MSAAPGGLRGAALGVFGAYTAAYFLSYFFRSTNAVLGPELQRDVGLGAGQLGFMTGAFFLAFALMQPLIGWSLDRWGARWVTTTGLLVAAGGSVAFAMGATYEALVAARLTIGAGMGCVLMGALASFGRWFDDRAYRTASSFLVGIGSLGAVVAASPLAAAARTIGWRGAFGAAAVLVVVAALAIALTDRRRRPSAAPSPPPSAASGAASSRSVLARNVDLWTLATLNLFMSGLLFSIQGLWGGPYLYEVYGLTSTTVGTYLTVMSLGAAAGFTGAGSVANRLGVKRTTNLSAATLLLALAGIAVLPPPVLLLAYLGFGMAGAFNILLLTQARFVVPDSHAARAVAFVNLAGIGGGFVLQWLLGVVLDRVPAASPAVTSRGAYLLALAACFVGLAIAWAVYARFHARTVRGATATPAREA